MDSEKNKLSVEERRELRNRILKSVSDYNRRKRISVRLAVYGSIAAGILLTLGLFFYLQRSGDPSIEDFVRSAPEVDYKDGDAVSIILDKGEAIDLEDNTSVQYSKSGTNVQLGSNQQVEQEAIRNDEAVFNTIVVPYGKRSQVKLSDGTLVWINSGSKLVYPATFKEEIRKVFLEGEAIFEVAHNPDQPFHVLSGHQEIEVLGTVFNVSHYSEDAEMQTVLKSGSIRISYERDKGGPSFVMEPGQLSGFDTESHSIRRQRVNVDDYFSWRDGFLTLRNHSLDYITTKLSRYYNAEIRIEDPDLSRLTFSGKLDLKEDVGAVLDLIKETTAFEVVRESDTIILK